MEPAKHHFEGDQDFHSIIYRSSDLDFDHDHAGGCGAKHDILERMADFQKTALENDVSTCGSQVGGQRSSHFIRGQTLKPMPNMVSQNGSMGTSRTLFYGCIIMYE